MAKPSVSPPAPNSSEGTAAKDDGLSERQRRRKRVGWALQQRNGGKTMKGSKEKQPAAMFTRELEVQLCSQIQVSSLFSHCPAPNAPESTPCQRYPDCIGCIVLQMHSSLAHDTAQEDRDRD